MNTNRKNARTAGFIYLFMGIAGAFGLMYMPSQIFVEGDAIATTANILNKEPLFRMGMLANMLCQTTFVFLVLSLKRLFIQVDKRLTNLMVSLVLVAVPIAFVQIISHMAALAVLKHPDLVVSYSQEQVTAMSMFFIELGNHTTMIVEIFWGLWLLPLGLLAYRSGFIPKLFGILLIIGCIGYVIQSITSVILPDWHKVTAMITNITGTIGEIPFLFWLLIKGANDPGKSNSHNKN